MINITHYFISSQPCDLFAGHRLEQWLPWLILFAALVLLTWLLISRTRSMKAVQEINRALTVSEQRWKFALKGAGDGVWDWNVQKNEMNFSKGWLEMLGFAEDEIESGFEEWERRIHPDDIEQLKADIQACLDGKVSTYVNEHRALCKDNSWIWILDRGMIVSRTKDGKPLRLIGTHSNITQRKKTEESLKLASMVYENSSEGMMVTDADGLIISINPAFTELTGYTLDEVIGKHHKVLSSGLQDEDFYKTMWQTIKTVGHWQGEISNQRKNGEIYAEWLTINTIFNEDGSAHRRVGLFVDITKKKESEKLIWKQANFDPLTGLPNRHMFQDRLGQEIKKASRTNLKLALMFLDLDRFKEVNDTLGHDQGDILLKEAARRLNNCVRETDTVARLGGDEFTVILGGLDDPSGVERVADRILQKLAEPFQLGTEKVYISASIGITLYPEDAATIEELLKNADQAMYAAKNQGRKRCIYFTPSMQEAAQNRMRLVNDLRDAIAGQQFLLVYQPIVDLTTGTFDKAEALIRWQHPTRGLVRPAEFISIAEETGMINDIGDWVFRKAAQQAKHWRTTYNAMFQISVNKSPVQFHDEAKNHVDWFEHLQKLGLSGQSIAVEITEGLLLDTESIVEERLLKCSGKGMQIALDDFGTGYSSLAYLKKFDIDYIKIDQSFVNNLAPDSNDMVLCEAIIVMAHKLGMKVIAEGVETQVQRDLLIAAGCDYGQGYLFSKPLAPEEFEKLFDISLIQNSTPA